MISFVIPFYNEEETLTSLYEELQEILNSLGVEYEIIFIDDGSTDNSFETLKELKGLDNKTRIVKFRRNYGQTAALQAGFNIGRGDIFISMDADLQNDPKDISLLLSKMEEGWDVVCGWRKDRKDSIGKKIASKISNWLVRRLTGIKLHDMGCTLRAYTKEAVKDLELYGELHRYLPVLISWKGFKLTEVEVNHRERKHGRTKYGLSRIITGFLDLMLVKFLLSYFSKPMLIFGGLGLISMLFGVVIGGYLVIQKYLFNITLADKPLLMLAILLIVFGVQFISTGLIADLIRRTHYTIRQVYEIEDII